MEYEDVGGLLKKTALVLTSRIGGTSGPDLGHGVPARRRRPRRRRPTLATRRSIAALRAGLEGIKQRGGADVGEKTLIDALQPAIDRHGSGAERRRHARAGGGGGRDGGGRGGRRDEGHARDARPRRVHRRALAGLGRRWRDGRGSDPEGSVRELDAGSAPSRQRGARREEVRERPAAVRPGDARRASRWRTPSMLRYVPEYNLIMRADMPRDDKVSIIQGSGSGHEPAHVMAVGPGMLDAACPGDVFAAPPPDYVYETSKLMNSAKGVLHIINNYTGDRLAFDMGRELAEAEGIKIGTVMVDDDVAVKDSTYTVGRRGVAGNFFVIKALGAASAAGAEPGRARRAGRPRELGDALDGHGAHLVHPAGQGLGAVRARRRRGRDGRRHPRRARPPAREAALVERDDRRPARGGRERPAVHGGRPRRRDGERPGRHADLRALPGLRPRPRVARRARDHRRRARTSASTAPRSRWPAARSRSSSSTTSWRSCWRRRPRSRCGCSERERAGAPIERAPAREPRGSGCYTGDEATASSQRTISA